MLRYHTFIAVALGVVVLLSVLGVVVSIADANYLRAGMLGVLAALSTLGARTFVAMRPRRRSSGTR